MITKNLKKSTPERILLDKRKQFTLIEQRKDINFALRLHYQIVFVILVIFLISLVTINALNANRGYALVKTQEKIKQIELENDRIRLEISQLKSPQRINQIAREELGMILPDRIYFSHN